MENSLQKKKLYACKEQKYFKPKLNGKDMNWMFKFVIFKI